MDRYWISVADKDLRKGSGYEDIKGMGLCQPLVDGVGIDFGMVGDDGNWYFAVSSGDVEKVSNYIKGFEGVDNLDIHPGKSDLPGNLEKFCLAMSERFGMENEFAVKKWAEQVKSSFGGPKYEEELCIASRENGRALGLRSARVGIEDISEVNRKTIEKRKSRR
ncbi:MAG: hypothetical protein V1888_01345 [archaeon]